MTSESFSDRFAYAVSVAQLRDGLQGTVDELRLTSTSNTLEDVLDAKGRQEIRTRTKHLGHQITVEEYNDAWAESYLAMVERDGSVERATDEMDRVLGKLLSTGKLNP